MKNEKPNSVRREQMKEQPQSVTLAQFRQKQLLAVTKPLWQIKLGLYGACMLKSALTGLLSEGRTTMDTVLGVANIASYLVIHAVPVAVMKSGRVSLLQPVCIASHLFCTLVFLSIGLGLAHTSEAVQVCLQHRLELVVEVALAFQDQMSPPVMAVLHALRQVAWMLILVWHMDGDPLHAVMRGVFNWVVMMVLSCLFEWRTRALYRKLCHTQQQEEKQQHEKQPSLPRPVPSLPLIEGASEFTSHLPEPVKPDKGEGSKSGQRTGSTPSEQPDPDAANFRPPAGSAATQLPEEGSSSSIQAAPRQRTKTILEQRYASCLPMTRVCIKIHGGVEVEDLPSGAPALLQRHLQARMPRVLLASMSVRSGCIVMTLDLRCDLATARSEEEGEACDDVTLPDGMMELVTHLTRSSTMGQMMGEGDVMCIQTPTGLVSCQWDGASESYRVVDTTGSTALTCPSDAAACRLLTASPAVHTLPDSPPALVAGPDPSTAAAGCHQLRLAVQLQLPKACRLDGWQPAADALPDGPGGSAMLLARRMGGGYLPVKVERVSCVVGPGGDEAGMRHTAEVVVAMDGKAPALLCLELWYKQPPTQMAAAGSELLVSHVPLLVLPSSWQAAAVQLQQHMDGMGGVQPCQAYPAAVADPASDAARCLLEDLGMWLTHHSSHHTATTAVPPTLMSRLHDALLSHATLHGLGDVAELMVTTQQRGEQQAAHSTATAHTPAGPSITRHVTKPVLSGLVHASGSSPPPAPPSVTPQSWLGSVIEVWTTRETDEYRAWTRQQRSGLVIPGAAIMTFLALGAIYRSFKAGCGLHEVPHLSVHVIPYVIMAAAIRGATWLGDWQSWMLSTHVFHSLGYLAKTYVPSGKACVWSTSTGTQNFIYVVVLGAVLDQAPLPLLLVAQLVETYCHSLAYASVGIEKPLRNACFAHGCALAVSTLCGVWQLRAFHRWQAAQQRSKQLKPKIA